jgi:hypothetical protein
MSQKFDAILVLGGGVPSSLYEPPIYVKQRCDDAAAIRGTTETPILTLSAGTAHLPQLLSKDGLPISESTSCRVPATTTQHPFESIHGNYIV